MSGGYLFRVFPTGTDDRRRQYWYANIADPEHAATEVMLAAGITFAASVQLATPVGPEVLDFLEIPCGEVRRN